MRKVVFSLLWIVILIGCGNNQMTTLVGDSEHNSESPKGEVLPAFPPASSSALVSSSQETNEDLYGYLVSDIAFSLDSSQSAFELFCYFLERNEVLTQESIDELSLQLDSEIVTGVKVIYKSYQKSVFSGAHVDIISYEAVEELTYSPTKAAQFCLTLNVKKSRNMYLEKGEQVWYIEISELPWENYIGPTSFMTEEKFNRVQSVVDYDNICVQIEYLLSMRSSPQLFNDIYEMDKSLIFEYIVFSDPDLKEYLNGQPIPEALVAKARSKCINKVIDFTSLKNYDKANSTYSFSPYGGHRYKYHFVGAIKKGNNVEIDVELEDLSTSITYQTLRYTFDYSTDFPILLSCKEIETVS